MGHLQGRTGREERERQKRQTGRGRQRGRPADAQEKSCAQLPARTLPTTPHAQTSQRAQKQHVNPRAGQRLREKTGLIENQALPSTRPLLQLLPPAPKSARPPLVSADEQTSNAKKTKSLTTPGCSLPVRPLAASPQRGRERERVPEPRQRRRRVRPWRAFLSGPSLRSPQL